MKKVLFGLALALALTACSSGVDQATHDAVVQENNELKSRISELESEIYSAESETISESSLTQIAEKYIAEADRDMFWVNHLVNSCKTIMSGNDDDTVITVLNASSEMQTTSFKYKAELLVAAASEDERKVESLHDTWVAYMQRFSESFETVYETLNEAISVHYNNG